MPMVERDREIKKRRNRFKKVKSLKLRLETERDAKTRARLLAKLKKIAPGAVIAQ
jgi:hypothetical protein